MLLQNVVDFALCDFFPCLGHGFSDVVLCDVVGVICVEMFEESIEQLIVEHRLNGHSGGKEFGIVYLPVSFVVYSLNDPLDLVMGNVLTCFLESIF